MQVRTKRISLGSFAVALISLSIIAGGAPQSGRHVAGANRIVSVVHLPEGTTCDPDPVTGPNGLKAADQWALQQLEPPLQAPKNLTAALSPQPQQGRPAAAPP